MKICLNDADIIPSLADTDLLAGEMQPFSVFGMIAVP